MTGTRETVSSLGGGDAGHLEWRCLVDAVVQPVVEQEAGVPAPSDHRRFPGIVLRIIVFRHLDGQSLRHVDIDERLF